MADLTYAFKQVQSDRLALLVHENICWPIKSSAEARRLAERLGTAGFWRIKPRHNV